jgi:asparagine synthase (glutamine-hydrolysing)
MEHRGPDQDGIKVFSGSDGNDNVFMGHKRLSILDLHERSRQPMTIGDNTIIYNGEVYNYKELIKEHNLMVNTTSDTEVVLLMYLKYGEKCLKYFNGMFALVIYNDKTKDTFVARDRLGIKPLYYYNKNEKIVLSSEIAGMSHIVDMKFYDFGIRQYKKLRMCVNNDTIYEDIKMFPAGCYMNNWKINRYWDVSVSEKECPLDENLKWLIESSVKLRRIADVEVGTYLSGGLDSTILTMLCKPEHTWTVGFRNLNEFIYGEAASRFLDIPSHHQVTITSKEFVETAKLIISIRQEPLSVPNEVSLFLMTKEVKKKNTVILSGEGADELFFGYNKIFEWGQRTDSFDDFDKYYGYGSHEDNEVVDYAFSNIKGHTSLQKLEYFFLTSHIHGLLRRLDNSTMMCSVEARVPFLDHRIVEAVAGVCFDWKMANKIPKAPLKRIFRESIPTLIVDRKKMGFPVPLNSLGIGDNGIDSWLSFNMKECIDNDYRIHGRSI